MSGNLRRRNQQSSAMTASTSTTSQADEEELSDYRLSRAAALINPPNQWTKLNWGVMAVLTVVAFATRFYKLNHPDQVVFDEVHFGKFASFYITGAYYFDVHPPFAKMLLGFAGWFAGYDGSFDFENIGDSYTKGGVPYVGIRALPAAMGALTIPLIYAIMVESGYPTIICAFSTILVLLDNGHIAQSRLILLDAQLVFFVALSLFFYVKFRKLRYQEFTAPYLIYLSLSGISLACTLGCKMVGLFTFLTIGTSVLIDLWGILDVKKEGHTMHYFYKHFVYRALGLILLPAIVYLGFFYIHFSLLTRSGTGDAFMSPMFQETLAENELLVNSHEIMYYDVVTMRHKDTKMYLHSHPETYPLKYEDGRISSQGQQVTGYGHNDTNNHWQIIPTTSIPTSGRGRIVRHMDEIQLRHVGTDTILLTHDVASPLMPTNQEVTTVSRELADGARYNDTLFRLEVENVVDGAAWKTKSGWFKLIHLPTRVGLWTHKDKGPLPEWAFKQQEVNGKKQVEDKSLIWFVEDIVTEDTGADLKNRTGEAMATKAPKKLGFLTKFVELQLLMLQHNAGLTASHPYASSPLNWPFLLSGISFWTDNDKKEQIYMIGNIVGYWICVMGLSVFVGVLGADLLARRRGIYPINDAVRNRLWNNAGFFFIAWAYHYFPFYLMNRQLFIHHYLPAHLCSALAAGAVLDFVLSETNNFPISFPGPKTRPRRATQSDLQPLAAVVCVAVLIVAMTAMFMYIAPLTYGTPSVEGDAINRRQLLSSWTLHFAAKRTMMD